MPGLWDEPPDRPAETLESPPERRSSSALVLAVVAGLLLGAAGAHEVQRRQAGRDSQSEVNLYGLFDNAETPGVAGRPDVSAGLRVYNAGPLPVTVASLAMTGSGLAPAATQSRAPVLVAPGSASLALSLRSDCTGSAGVPLTVTVSVRTADGRSRRVGIPLDHYSDGYLAVNAACTEARLRGAAPLPDISVTVDSARVVGSGRRAVLRWRIALTGEPGIQVSALALTGHRLRLTPRGLPRTFNTTDSPPVSADVAVPSCAGGPLQPADFLLTWAASRRGPTGLLQKRLANMDAVPPSVVLLTTRYAAQVCAARH